MIVERNRTYNLGVKDPLLSDALKACLLQAKNITNGTLFILKNVFSSYENEVQKSNLHENQLRAIEAANAAIEHANSLPKREPISLLSQNGNPFSLLDMTIVRTIATAIPGFDDTNPYRTIPDSFANAVAQSVRSDFQNYFKALKAWKANGSNPKTRPAFPNYLPKDGSKTIDLPICHSRKNYKFPKLTGRNLPSNYDCSEYLDESSKSAFDAFGLEDIVDKIKSRTKLPQDAEPKVLRILLRKGKPSIQIIFGFSHQIPDNSLTHKASKLDQLSPSEIGPFGTMDLGLNNLGALAFGNASIPAVILTASKIEKRLQKLDSKIDKRKSEISPSELKELDALPVLTRTQSIRRRQLLKELHSDQLLRRLIGQKDSFTHNALKQAVSQIIQSLTANGCQLLIVGHNKDWKSESNLGRFGNRRFHNLPHSKFLSLLRSSCEAHNILLVTTEESYTSQTSFINSATLPTFSKTPKPKVIKTKPLGKRNQHKFTNSETKSKPANWTKTIHSDLNAAYNIARKIFKWFVFSADTCLQYSLLGLTQKFGFQPFLSGLPERSACPG